MKIVSATLLRAIANFVRPRCIFLLACLLGAGCATQSETAVRPGARASYRVYWTAIRASDNVPLLSVSSRAKLGRISEAITDAPPPAENRPAVISVGATVTKADESGGLNLRTFVKVREAIPNKKGKLKITKRNVRSLIPIRIGETQVVSSLGDSIRLEVRIESDETRI